MKELSDIDQRYDGQTQSNQLSIYVSSTQVGQHQRLHGTPT